MTILIIIIFFVFLIIFSKNDEDVENKDLDLFKNTSYKKKEEEFYHPVTGYKGTKSEMDTYIMNRERKLK